jgi:hypothetical protein
VKYFVYNNQRDGTCYHEFYKGKWNRWKYWKSDSIFLDDDYLFKGFSDAIKEIVPYYDPFGATKISIDQWNKIGEIITAKDIESQEVYHEADLWLKEQVFHKHKCFTILGI